MGLPQAKHGLDFETTVIYECRGEASARAWLVVAPTAEFDRRILATYRIEGHVVGPTCRYSSTLQARIPLAHRGFTTWGGRSAITAEAVVPDPCYWSTELPFLYRAVGAIETGSAGQVPFDLKFGMRSLAVVRNRIILNGKVWVPRGAAAQAVGEAEPISSWRDLDVVMVVEDPSDALCDEANEAGVAIIAIASGDAETVRKSLVRLSRHPSVMICYTDDLSDEATVDKPAPNLLTARLSTHFTDWDQKRCDVWFYERENAVQFEFLKRSEKPVIIVNDSKAYPSLADARRECDAIQAELAGRGDPAGYIV